MGAYTDLKDDVARWLGRDRESDLDLEAALDRLLKNAQLRVAREFEFVVWNAEESITCSPASPLVPRSTASIGLVALEVRTPASSVYSALKERDLAWVRAWWPNQAATGKPRYFALADNDEFFLAPTPDVGYVLRHTFRRIPPYLSSAAEDNEMSARFYDALLAAAVREGADFSQEDRREDLRNRAEDRFQQIKAAAGKNELARNNAASQGGPNKAP